jgi:hypothetical protein
MTSDLGAAVEQLQRAHRAFGLSRDREDAGQCLRLADDQADRLLNQQPNRFHDRHIRHRYRQVRGYTILAEESLRGHAPVA